MKVLITGHTGLVGKHLVNKLKSMDCSVSGISKSDGFDLIDAKTANLVLNIIKPDVVFHLAANAAESRGQVSPIDMTQNNVNIFVNTLRAAINAGVKKFVYVSSVSVYGEALVPYKEDGETIPRDVYGVNKLACEQILKIMAKVYGFEYVILRPHNIYGPEQKMNDPYRNVVALFMRNLLEGKPYKLFDEGKMMRAFSYVDDVVEVMAKAIEDGFNGKTINVGSDKAISIKELSDIIQTVSGLTTEIEYEPARPQEISMFLADHALQHSLSQYHETPMFDGIKATWDWVKSINMGEIIKKENEINV